MSFLLVTLKKCNVSFFSNLIPNSLLFLQVNGVEGDPDLLPRILT